MGVQLYESSQKWSAISIERKDHRLLNAFISCMEHEKWRVSRSSICFHIWFLNHCWQRKWRGIFLTKTTRPVLLSILWTLLCTHGMVEPEDNVRMMDKKEHGSQDRVKLSSRVGFFCICEHILDFSHKGNGPTLGSYFSQHSERFSFGAWPHGLYISKFPEQDDFLTFLSLSSCSAYFLKVTQTRRRIRFNISHSILAL